MASRQYIGLIVGAGLTALLPGCNQPAVALKPLAFQDSANTIRDWDTIADKIVAKISAQRAATGGGPGYGYLNGPFFVHSTSPRSTFLHEVADRLKVGLGERGFVVATNPVNATVINLKVDVIRWGPRDKPPGGAGTLAGVVGVAGVLVGATAPFTVWEAARAGAWGAGSAGILSDLVTAMTPTMNSEAAWEATIVTGDRILMSMREPLYVRDLDIPLYSGGVQTAEISGADFSLVPRRIRLDP